MDASNSPRPRSRAAGFRFYCDLARTHEADGRVDAAWACLEAAHILGQDRTPLHVRSHIAMLGLAWRMADLHEVRGQVARSFAAAIVTWLWVPTGNTGRASMSALRSAPLPEDLQSFLDVESSADSGSGSGARQ